MKDIFEFIRNRHHQIFKVFLFLLAVVLIVLIFPRERKFKYEFQKGKPWPHEDLIAAFDFPILKSQEEIEEERKRVEEEQKIYFFESEKIKQDVLASFENSFFKTWNNYLSKADSVVKQLNISKQNEYYLKANNILIDLYEKGIIELYSGIENQSGDFEIYVLRENVAIKTELKDVYTITQAFNKIQNEVKTFNVVERNLILNAIEEKLQRNIYYDQETNEQIKQQALAKISPNVGMIQEGEKVVAKGEILTDKRFKILESLKAEYESQFVDDSNFSWILLGQTVLVVLMIFLLALFLLSYRVEIIRSDLKISFLLFLIIIFVLPSKYAIDHDFLNLYALPFCMLPLIVRTFFDIRVALFTYLVAILTIGFIAPNPYEFTIIQLIAGILTLLSVSNLRKRSQLFLSSLIVFGAYTLVYLSIELVQEATWERTNWEALLWFLFSSLLTLLTYPLVYAFEKIFGFVSDVSLMELSDTNSKLLRKLNLKAPGTFQHSLQVSNLAEEAIREIGGNSLLVRTGAMYHDIGKMHAPNYFIENQVSDYNPHNDLSPEESAGIIIDHVIQGIEMARRYKLPDIIIDFIRTHHGTTKTQYFYKQYIERFGENETDDQQFTYPGPIPYSKETAVLMMADSVEAASRSLPQYDANSIENLVDGIIDYQVKEQQFIMSDITFKDITVIKKMFKKKLMSIYHVRVEYPE